MVEPKPILEKYLTRDVNPRLVCLFCRYYNPSSKGCTRKGRVRFIEDPRTQTCEEWRYCA